MVRDRALRTKLADGGEAGRGRQCAQVLGSASVFAEHPLVLSVEGMRSPTHRLDCSDAADRASRALPDGRLRERPEAVSDPPTAADHHAHDVERVWKRGLKRRGGPDARNAQQGPSSRHTSQLAQGAWEVSPWNVLEDLARESAVERAIRKRQLADVGDDVGTKLPVDVGGPPRD